MQDNGETPMAKPPQRGISNLDALILGGAVIGILMGVSLLSYEAAVVVGVMLLIFVIWKVFTTKG